MVFSEIASLINNPTSGQLKQDTTSTDYKMEFLKLMMTQLRHQDPTNPVDSSEMLAQQAQFASLEQLQNLNTTLVSLMAMENVTQATTLLGKQVAGIDVNGQSVAGQVVGMSFVEGNPTLSISDGVSSYQMTIANVSNIGL